MIIKSVVVTATGVLLTACVVGPDFRKPSPPDVKAYTSRELPQNTESAAGPTGAAQHFVTGLDIPAQWWQLFQSPSLDQAIRQALADNPNLAAAQATLRQAQENVNAAVGSALFPAVDANASTTRQKISGASFGQPDTHFPPFTLYNASVSVTYALDFFGGARRELEALRSQVDYQCFQFEGAYLTIASNIVTNAVKEASLRAQIAATKEIIAAEEKQLDLVERQFQLGAASRPDTLAQRTQLAQTRATLPPLEKALDQNRHQLSVLVGKLPGDAATFPTFDFDALKLPQDIPVSLPSDLVRQRPDIRAAESLLHAANAQVGVATANLYPQIKLSGSFGSESLTTGRLFTGGSSVWSASGGLTQPLFHGGELTAQRRAAIAAYDQALAQYRAAVLQAFQNVADVLRALDADAAALKAESEAEAAARDSLELSKKQFQLGAVNYLSLLNAQRGYQEARIGTVQAQALRLADTAALFQALGGGWWNEERSGSKAVSAEKIAGKDSGDVREKSTGDIP